MMFWDASAVVPLCVDEEHSAAMRAALRDDPAMVVWWGTLLECRSALARLLRGDILDVEQEESARQPLRLLAESWTEILPGTQLRQQAIRSLSVHDLRAADSLQLAAALVWSGNDPVDHYLVCLDNRLRSAGRKEGFSIRPE